MCTTRSAIEGHSVEFRNPTIRHPRFWLTDKPKFEYRIHIRLNGQFCDPYYLLVRSHSEGQCTVNQTVCHMYQVVCTR